MSDQGNLIRLPVADIRRTGRNTQGVRLINLTTDQQLIGAVRLEEENGRHAIDVATTELAEANGVPLTEDEEDEEEETE
jgi:DNA gyrase subunit A